MKRIFISVFVAVALLFFGAVAGAAYVIFNARITGGDGLYYMEIAGHIHVYEGGAEETSAARPDVYRIGAGAVSGGAFNDQAGARSGAVSEDLFTDPGDVLQIGPALQIVSRAPGTIASPVFSADRAGAVALQPGARCSGAVSSPLPSGAGARPVRAGAVPEGRPVFLEKITFSACYPFFLFSSIFSAPARAKAFSGILAEHDHSSRAFGAWAVAGLRAAAFPGNVGAGAVADPLSRYFV